MCSQYCSRRLRRLRVGLGFTNGKREFKSRPLDAGLVTDVRFLGLALVSAERCWAYAMQLKNDMTAETQRKRIHLLKRLTKAASWAKLLEELCASRADTRTQLQAEAYAAWLAGSVLFERNAHDKALANFLHAKEVYDKLGSIGGSSVQILCEERVASLQDSIRFSKYMLRHKAGAAQSAGEDEDEGIAEDLAGAAGGNELLAAKLETLRQEKLLAQAQSLDTVQWQGKTIPVSNEKLRLSFVEARNLKLQLDKALEATNAKKQLAAAAASSSSSSSASGPAPAAAVAADSSNKDGSGVVEEPTNLSLLFQKLFVVHDDALKVLRDSLLESKMLEAHKAHLLALQQYATASRLAVQITRNRQFVSNVVATLHAQESRPREFQHRRKTKPDEAVVLYEKLIANLSELGDIAASDKSAAAPAQAKVIAAQVAAATAQRVFYLAESYRRLRQFLPSYLLYTRALELADGDFAKASAKVSKEDLASPAAKDLAEDTARVQALRSEATTLRGQVHAQALLAEAEQAAKVSQQLQEKLKIGEGASAIVVAPPALTLPARLDLWDAGDNNVTATGTPAAIQQQNYALLDFPPSFQSAPAKPILFDLAFNAIQYPDINAKLKKMAAAKNAAPAPAPATAAAASSSASAAAATVPAAKKEQPAAKTAKQPEPEEEEEAPKPAKAAAPKPAAQAQQPKKIAPPNESKADRAARERREREEEERKAAAAAEAAKKKGWGLGGLVGKFFG